MKKPDVIPHPGLASQRKKSLREEEPKRKSEKSGKSRKSSKSSRAPSEPEWKKTASKIPDIPVFKNPVDNLDPEEDEEEEVPADVPADLPQDLGSDEEDDVAITKQQSEMAFTQPLGEITQEEPESFD